MGSTALTILKRKIPAFIGLFLAFTLLSAFGADDASTAINCSCSYATGLISNPSVGNSQYILDFGIKNQKDCSRVCRNIDPENICNSLSIRSGDQYTAWVDTNEETTQGIYHRSCPRK